MRIAIWCNRRPASAPVIADLVASTGYSWRVAMATSDHYTYRVTWSAEDEEYVGSCAEFPSLSWLAPTSDEALAGIREMVVGCVEDMRAHAEERARRVRPDVLRHLEDSMRENEEFGEAPGAVDDASGPEESEPALARRMPAGTSAHPA